MKKRNCLIIIFTLILTVIFYTSVLSLANKAPQFKRLAGISSISSRGEIKVPFDNKINGITINNANIYVLDGNKRKVSILASLDVSGKIVIVKPKTGYEPGKSYTLYITNGILFTNGKHPLAGVRLDFVINNEKALPVVGTIANLKKLLAASQQYNTSMLRTDEMPIAADSGAAAATNSKAAVGQAAENGTGGDFSKTNLQVDGVDEADIVKTDGEYIYQVNSNHSIVITKAVPVTKMQIAEIIKFNDNSFNPQELYVDDNYLVVIGQSYNNFYEPKAEKAMPPMRPIPYMNQTTKAIVYNIANKNIIKKVREVELEGNYVSSRKIGTRLYLITNRYINYYYQQNNDTAETGLTPYYRDTARSREFIQVKCDAIRYFPDSVEGNYMIIGTFDIGNNDKYVNVSTYLGSGQSVYMSENNLYVAVNKFTPAKGVEPQKQGGSGKDTGVNVKPMPGILWPGYGDRNMVIYKFALTYNSLSGGLNAYGVSFVSKGEVPGTILNQFSMDENNNSFRIATTKGEVFGTNENTSKNNLYILNSDMKITGKIEGMAPGEKIYSVRFMGDRAYVVTFKKVDPLFVIDLADQKNPRILGALKIPGYSDYLQPYDEDHIIGIGKDTIELPYKDGKGNVIGTNAFYLGMKIAIFDVTDVKNPKENCHEIIGDRGTYSAVLNDHKALLFSKEKNLIAFPITVYRLQEGQKTVNDQSGSGYVYPEYGAFDFQGAYVFSIDLSKGFILKGKITHMTSEDYLKAGMKGYDYNKEINRILYINNMLYTTSNKMVKATSLSDMKDKAEADIN